MKPLVSVIIPMYNVLPWLKECLDSVKSQSLSNIEVIIIDDGSTDGSGELAEQYCSDSRFRCVHTENQGISAARNRGIEESKADYIMFVDSDDWVDKYYCELPYNAAVEADADMVVFRRYLTDSKGRVKRDKRREVPCGLIDHETALDVGGGVPCNKIYRKSLFDGIRYPEGHVHEDTAITHQLIYKSKVIVSIENKLYYYRFRQGSICHSMSKIEDYLVMNKKRYSDLVELGYPKEKAELQLYITALRCCGRAKLNSPVYKESCKILEGMKGIPKGLSASDKIKIKVWRFNKTLYNVIYRNYALFSYGIVKNAFRRIVSPVKIMRRQRKAEHRKHDKSDLC